MSEGLPPVRSPKKRPLQKAKPIVLRFGLPPQAPRRLEATAFREALLRTAGVDIRLVALPTYAGLFHAVDSGACDLAWTPPLIGLDLVRCGSASPLLSLVRARGSSYYAVFLSAADARPRGVGDLGGSAIGWVAPESAAGYVIPRLYLGSLGIEPAAFFGSERYLGSHLRSAQALAAGEVDVIATYAHFDDGARRFVPPPMDVAPRVLAAAGPIPGDLIMARDSLPPALRETLARGLLALSDEERASLVPLMNARRFERAAPSHLDPLRSLWARAADGVFRQRSPSLAPASLPAG
jgi:phosphonate transport system substrate-binding protein